MWPRKSYPVCDLLIPPGEWRRVNGVWVSQGDWRFLNHLCRRGSFWEGMFLSFHLMSQETEMVQKKPHQQTLGPWLVTTENDHRRAHLGERGIIHLLQARVRVGCDTGQRVDCWVAQTRIETPALLCTSCRVGDLLWSLFNPEFPRLSKKKQPRDHIDAAEAGWGLKAGVYGWPLASTGLQ